MRKVTAYIMIVMLSAAMGCMMLTGCNMTGSNTGQSGTAESSTGKTDTPKTIGDTEKYESYGYTYDDKLFVEVYEDNGVYYRAEAELPEDVSKALDDLDWSDDDHDQNMKALIDPLPITKLENLSENILSQEEMDKLIGKTGEDLLNDGWTTGFVTETGGSSVNMEYDLFQYIVTFDGVIEESEDVYLGDVIIPLVVKAVEYAGISSSASEAFLYQSDSE